MDEPASTGRRGYQSMLHTSHLHRAIQMSKSLLSRGALVFFIALVSVGVFVTLFSSQENASHHPVHLRYQYHVDTPRSRSNSFRSLDNNNPHHFTSRVERYSDIVSPYWTNSYQQRLVSFPYASRTDTSCASAIEDFFEDSEVNTGDCSPGLLCRARIILRKQGATITIQAGYNIFVRKGVVEVDEASKRNAGAVTRSEADKWAKQLLNLIRPRLEVLNCEVTQATISDAIMQTKDAAAQCPRTDDSLCTELQTIKTCTVVEPLPLETEQQKECRAFLESEISVSSLAELKKSPCIVWPTNNVVFMNVPFCKARCTEDGCARQKLIYADFGIVGMQKKPLWDLSDHVNSCNAVATVFVSLFNTWIGKNIPNCDDVRYPSSPWFLEGMTSMDVASIVPSDEEEFYVPNDIPQKFQDIVAESHGSQVLSAMYILPMEFAPYIEWQCSEG